MRPTKATNTLDPDDWLSRRPSKEMRYNLASDYLGPDSLVDYFVGSTSHAPALAAISNDIVIKPAFLSPTARERVPGVHVFSFLS